VKNHPVKAQAPDQPGSVILAKEPVLQVCLFPKLQI
jgi:tRNA (guanine26-N2/guanine27-N2)-dimethyltransferase